MLPLVITSAILVAVSVPPILVTSGQNRSYAKFAGKLDKTAGFNPAPHSHSKLHRETYIESFTSPTI